MNIIADNSFTRDMQKLGKKFIGLRYNEVLVIGSGNIIHNLSDVDLNDDTEPFKWAEEFDLLSSMNPFRMKVFP